MAKAMHSGTQGKHCAYRALIGRTVCAFRWCKWSPVRPRGQVASDARREQIYQVGKGTIRADLQRRIYKEEQVGRFQKADTAACPLKIRKKERRGDRRESREEKRRQVGTSHQRKKTRERKASDEGKRNMTLRWRPNRQQLFFLMRLRSRHTGNLIQDSDHTDMDLEINIPITLRTS